MVKSVMPTADWRETQQMFRRGGKQWYVLRVNPVIDGDNTLSIEEMYDHEPTEEDKTSLRERYLALAKKVVLSEIGQYDKSADVNHFTLGTETGWLDKATRVGLQNSIAVEKAAGRTTTTLYLNDIPFEISIEKAEEVLSALELYAIACYRQTEAHKAAVKALDSINETEGYDFRSGYPEALTFEL